MIVINDDANSGNKEKERDYSQPSSVLTRVRSFLPKIANANRNLPADNTADGFEIINLDNSKNFSNLDCSSESDSSDGEAEVFIMLAFMICFTLPLFTDFNFFFFFFWINRALNFSKFVKVEIFRVQDHLLRWTCRF